MKLLHVTFLSWLCIVGAGFGQSSEDGSDQKQPEGYTISNASNKHSAPPFSVPVRILEQADNKTDADRMREAEADQRDKEDLVTQQEMSKFAQWTFFLSVGQFILAIIGALGLLITLVLTRRSLVAAEQATKTSVQAVTLTQKISERELRAYVLVEETEIRYLPNGASEVIIGFKNTGQTPALDLVTEAWHYDVFDGRQIVRSPQASKFSIGAGASRFKHVGPIGPDTTTLLRNGQLRMDITGIADYRDVFGRQHWTKFHLVCGGASGFEPGGAHVHSENNEEDRDEAW